MRAAAGDAEAARARAERAVRRVCVVGGASGLALGLIVVCVPSTVYGWARIPFDDPLTQTLYGAVLVGVGVAGLRAAARPLAAPGLLFFVAAYKLVAVVALVPRLLLLPEAPVAGWVIVGLWAASGSVAAWAYGLTASRSRRRTPW